MPTYYDVLLTTNIPHGSDILNKPCKITFSYADGSNSDTYSGTVLSWPSQSSLRISSAYLNINDAWAGSTGGVIIISDIITYNILNFGKVPQ